jgi:hypothetical protein
MRRKLMMLSDEGEDDENFVIGFAEEFSRVSTGRAACLGTTKHFNYGEQSEEEEKLLRSMSCRVPA